MKDSKKPDFHDNKVWELRTKKYEDLVSEKDSLCAELRAEFEEKLKKLYIK